MGYWSHVINVHLSGAHFPMNSIFKWHSTAVLSPSLPTGVNAAMVLGLIRRNKTYEKGLIVPPYKAVVRDLRHEERLKECGLAKLET